MPKKQTDDILAKRALFGRSTLSELGQIIKALATRYGIPSSEALRRDPAADMTGYEDLAGWRTEAIKQRAEAEFWRRLAYRLARAADIPAFLPPQTDEYQDSRPAWHAAGGSDIDAPDDFTTFDQARFALAIREIEQGGGLSREKAPSRKWVFRWLLNLEATTTPEKAMARRALLPLRYRAINAEGAMDVTYYKVPEEVRDFPERYLPADDPRRTPEHWPGWDGGGPLWPTTTSGG